MSWQEGGARGAPQIMRLHKFSLDMGMRKVDVSYRKWVDDCTGVTRGRELFLGPLRLAIDGSVMEFGKSVVKIFLGRLKPSEAASMALSLVVSCGGKDDREELTVFTAGMIEGLVEEQFGVASNNGVGPRLKELQAEEVVNVVRALRERNRIDDWDFARVMAGCGYSEARIVSEMKVCVDGRSKEMAMEVLRVMV